MFENTPLFNWASKDNISINQAQSSFFYENQLKTTAGWPLLADTAVSMPPTIPRFIPRYLHRPTYDLANFLHEVSPAISLHLSLKTCHQFCFKKFKTSQFPAWLKHLISTFLNQLTKTDCIDRIHCFQRILTSQHLWTKVLTKILP